MTLEGAIMVVLVACGLLWAGAHIHDAYIERKRQQRRDRWR